MGEWVLGTTIRTLRDYHGDPFPHALPTTRSTYFANISDAVLGFLEFVEVWYLIRIWEPRV